MPTVVSLFSGCGGSDAGVLRAGFDVLMVTISCRMRAMFILPIIQKLITY